MGSASQQPSPVDPEGMSLDQLSRAFAAMLGQSADEPKNPLLAIDDAPDQPADNPETAASKPHPEPAPEVSSGAVPITPLNILESMLFVGRPDNVPLTSQQMAGLIRGVTAEEIDSLIVELNGRYAANGCPYTIFSEGGGYRLALRDEFSPLRQRFYGRLRKARLSPAAIEVLALVAYREPLTADEVARLRGIPSGHILTHLVRRKLLRLDRTDPKSRK